MKTIRQLGLEKFAELQADEEKDSEVKKGPLGLPEGTGQQINQAMGKPGMGKGREEGREGRVQVLKKILEELNTSS